MSFSGNKWVDYQILNKMSDSELTETFKNNENLRVYEEDDNFWGDRLAVKFSYLVKPKEMTNKEFYQSLVPIMLILHEGDPLIIIPPTFVTQDYLTYLRQEVEMIENQNADDYEIILYVSEEMFDLVSFEFDDGLPYDFDEVQRIILEGFEKLSDQETQDLFLEDQGNEEFYLGLDKIPPYINGLINWYKNRESLLVPI